MVLRSLGQDACWEKGREATEYGVRIWWRRPMQRREDGGWRRRLVLVEKAGAEQRLGMAEEDAGWQRRPVQRREDGGWQRRPVQCREDRLGSLQLSDWPGATLGTSALSRACGTGPGQAEPGGGGAQPRAWVLSEHKEGKRCQHPWDLGAAKAKKGGGMSDTAGG